MTALEIFNRLDQGPVSDGELRRLVSSLALMVDVLQMQQRDGETSESLQQYSSREAP